MCQRDFARRSDAVAGLAQCVCGSSRPDRKPVLLHTMSFLLSSRKVPVVVVDDVGSLAQVQLCPSVVRPRLATVVDTVLVPQQEQELQYQYIPRQLVQLQPRRSLHSA